MGGRKAYGSRKAYGIGTSGAMSHFAVSVDPGARSLFSASNIKKCRSLTNTRPYRTYPGNMLSLNHLQRICVIIGP